MGIDLAGSPARNTGFCLLDPTGRAETLCLHEDREVVEAILAARPSTVGIDAPLSLPRGRLNLETPGPPHFRKADLELRARRIPFFPVTLGPMRMLTARGIRLAAGLRAFGFPVWEVYPGGAQDLLGLPRKTAGVLRLARALSKLGVQGNFTRSDVTHDELDAVTGALVCHLQLRGKAELYGDPDEGQILMPLPRARPNWSRAAATRSRTGRRRQGRSLS